MTTQCKDCGVPAGSLHEIFCSHERCPYCRGQLVSCGCISSVLKLTASEQTALDEYIDDTEEPLKSVIERWSVCLNQKGRLPFQP